MTIKDFISIIEERIPKGIQESFDNSGVQIGPFDQEMKSPILTLDISTTVVNKALELNSNLIISHHPLFFNPIKTLSTNTAKTGIIKQLLENEITVYASHTPIDKITGGMNDYFCNLLELSNVEGIIESGSDDIYKVQVFVPDSHKEPIVDKIAELGGGWIGNYSECTFSTTGIGTFKPHEGTNPFIGRHNEREYTNESKIETVISKDKVDFLISEVERVHPYEEVAMEAFPLYRPHFPHYICRKGDLKVSLTLSDLITKLKTLTQQKSIRYNGDDKKRIKKIAVCTGSGASFLHNIANETVDVFITGDVGYHDFQLAQERGFSIIEITHNNTERYFPYVFQEFFKDLDIIFHKHFYSFLKEF